MADRNRSKKRDSIARALHESCLFPYQGIVSYFLSAPHSRRPASLDECLLPYSGVLCGKLGMAA